MARGLRYRSLGLASGPALAEVPVKATLDLPELVFDFGGRVNIGDPNDLSGVGFGQITIAPVPEPSTVWLLVAGSGILVVFWHRQP